MRRMIIAATILAPTAAFAGGYLVPSMNPRDLALGGASVSDAQGADAVSLNTAALAGQEGLDVSVAGGVINNATTWSNADQKSSVSEVGTPPSVAVSYGMRLPNDQALGFGVGFGVVGGGSLSWPTGWAGSEVIQSVKQQIFGVGGGVAFQALPWLKFGASYLRLQSTLEIHQSLNFLDHSGDAGIAMAGGANTFGLAAEAKIPTLPLKFGVSYVHAADLDMSGHLHFTDVPPAFQPLLHDQGITETTLVPDVLFVGASYEVIPNLKVLAAYSFEHWSDYKNDHFVGSDTIQMPGGMPMPAFQTTVARNYNNAQVYRLAGEWGKIAPSVPWLTARAGVGRSISDQPADTLSPSLTDASSWTVSLGAGLEINRNLHVDAGFEHAFFDKVTAAPGSETFQGSYETGVNLFSIGLNWRTDLGMARR